MRTPPLAMVWKTPAAWIGVDGVALAEQDRVALRAAPVLGPGEQARRLAGEARRPDFEPMPNLRK